MAEDKLYENFNFFFVRYIHNNEYEMFIKYYFRVYDLDGATDTYCRTLKQIAPETDYAITSMQDLNRASYRIV